MPPKKGKTSSKSEEKVSNNTQGSGENGQLTGAFATDFPILCTKNELLPIVVRNIETLEPTDRSSHWIWYKPDIPDDPNVKKIEHISIRGLKVTGSFMTVLQTSLSATLVSQITLWETGIDAHCLSLLADLLPQLQCRILDIGGSVLTDLNPIKKILTECKSLLELSLRCCQLTDKLLDPVGVALKGDPPLQQLDLSNNKLGDVGMKELANALRSNRNLLSLSLAGNCITDIGAVHLSEVLKEFPLNHEEIVQRRTLLSQLHQSEWTSLSETKELSRKSSSRKNIYQKDTGGKKTPSAGGLMKAASFLAKVKKGAESKKSSTKTGKGGNVEVKTTPPPSTPSRPPSTIALTIKGPLIDGVVERDSQIMSPGNSSLANLCLAYNQISVSGLEALFSAVQYQIEQGEKGALPHGTGLLNMALQNNAFSDNHPTYEALQKLITNKYSSLTTQSTTNIDELKP